MADRTLYKTENVKLGQKANWPNESDYVEPSKNGYVFNGWDFDWENTSITETTPENHEIHPIWDKILRIVAEANRTVVSSDGDSITDPTKMYYYIVTENGKTISDEVNFTKVELEDNETELAWSNLNDSTENGKNIKVGVVLPNGTDLPKYYRFKATTTDDSKYGLMESDIVEIVQAGDGQILLPEFDYFVFTYNWTDNDGTDLDSLTCLDSTIDGSPNPVDLWDDVSVAVFPVSFGALCKNSNAQNFSYPAGVNVETNTIHHSGDNKESGMEGAVIDIKSIISAMTYSTITVDDTSVYTIGGFYNDGVKNYEITNIDEDGKSITYKSGYVDNYSKLVFNIYNYWYEERDDGNSTITFDAYKGGEITIDTTNHTFTPSSDSEKVIDTDSKTISIISGTKDTNVSMGKNAESFFGSRYSQRGQNPVGWGSNFRDASEYDNFIKKCDFFFTKTATLTYDIKSKTTLIKFNNNPQGIVKFERLCFLHGFYGVNMVMSIPNRSKVPSDDLLSVKADGTEVVYQTGKETDDAGNYEHYTDAYKENTGGVTLSLEKGNYYIVPASCHVQITLASIFDDDNSLINKATDSNGKEYTWKVSNAILSSTLINNSPYKRIYDYDASTVGESGSSTDEKGNVTSYSRNGTITKIEYADILSNIELSEDKRTLSFDVNNQDTTSSYYTGVNICLLPDPSSSVVMNDNAKNSGVEYSPALMSSFYINNYGGMNTIINLLINHA